jgi:hypothetical protein
MTMVNEREIVYFLELLSLSTNPLWIFRYTIKIRDKKNKINLNYFIFIYVKYSSFLSRSLKISEFNYKLHKRIWRNNS